MTHVKKSASCYWSGNSASFALCVFRLRSISDPQRKPGLTGRAAASRVTAGCRPGAGHDDSGRREFRRFAAPQMSAWSPNLPTSWHVDAAAQSEDYDNFALCDRPGLLTFWRHPAHPAGSEAYSPSKVEPTSANSTVVIFPSGRRYQ